ncbi:hypothetical protein ILUMI_25908 [Ignelater luminosus]|uniref:Uncharacterized protein n=1 Tax=Ignelater luminosus TaxID=2038154 RepID=A0A8K0FW31_IGNLU|nr:hypothetical protein ILUMI_25908 [Ignelater luminosus]
MVWCTWRDSLKMMCNAAAEDIYLCSSTNDFSELTRYSEDSDHFYRDSNYAASDNENENILPGLTYVSDDSEVKEAENIQLIGSNSNSSNEPVEEGHQELFES